MTVMPYNHERFPDRDALRRVIDDTYAGVIADAARAAGLHPTTLGNIVSGHRTGHADTFARLAEAWDVPVDTITKAAA